MTVRVVHEGAGEMWSQVDYRTIVDLVAAAGRTAPHAPAMISEDGLVVTRGQYVDRAERLAGALRERIKPGDRVAVMLGNRAEWMIAWLAVVANRAVLVSVNPQAMEHDALHVLRDSGSCLLIAGDEQRPVVELIRSECSELREIWWVGEPEPDGLRRYSNTAERLSFAAADCHRLDITNFYYTSGTTGSPKGCMTDHENWLRSLDVDLRLHPKGPGDRWLCCLQFFYKDPGRLFLDALHSGGPVVIMRRFSVSRFWDVVRDHEVTQILSFASIPALLLKAPPNPRDRDHKVRRALQVAVPPRLHRQIHDRWGFPWVDGYGLSEGGFVARVPLSHAVEMIGSGSMGVPCPEVRVRIVDEEHRDVGVNEPGQILVSAPGMFRGYVNRPEVTVQTLAGGWLHTGDIARQDERGFLYFMGRSKDIIRRSGENVSAAEVEEVLRSHPRVLEAAVIAVPDELRGEEIKAYVMTVPGASQDTLSPAEIVAWCARKLAKYKIPRYIEYRTIDFPRTPSMRVKKEELRAERRDLAAGAWDREAPESSPGAGRPDDA